MTEQLRRTVESLLTRYVRIVDEDRLEEWPDLFTETCLYRIITRENLEQNMALAVMECRSRGMLRDRVTGYRKINVYEPQRYSHQVSALEMEFVDEHTVKCRSNYLVVRIVTDGTMTLFSTGTYHDTVVFEDGIARFQERIVVQDSRRVETLLVIPL